MPYIIEPTLRELLWSWLEEKRGCEVWGEVNIGVGRIDLVAKNKSGELIGYEVKTESSPIPEGWARGFAQIRKYSESGYLDRIFYCSEDPMKAIERFEPTRPPREMGMVKIPLHFSTLNMKERIERNLNFRCMLLDDPKVAFDPEEGDDPEIIKEANTISHQSSQKPKFQKNSEAWVRHYVWREFGMIREGAIPDPTEGTEKKIDVLAFAEETDPTKIYSDPECGEIIGIEAKGAKTYDREKISSQLESYLNSGCLTGLYLAVPESKSRVGKKILRDDKRKELAKIGLFSVDTEGNVKKVSEAEKLELKFDGYILNNYVRSIGYGRVKPPKEGEHKLLLDLETGKKVEEKNKIWVEEGGKINYQRVSNLSVSKIKEKAKELELDYKKLLEAEKNNQDRATAKSWCYSKIRGKKHGEKEGFKEFQRVSEKKEPKTSQGCFIASATYESPLTKELELFRNFRDVKLKRSNLGKSLVRLYYKISPPLAKILSVSDLSKKLVRRVLLDPIAKKLEFSD